MELLIIGIVTAINLIILKIKYEHGRYADLFLDIVAFISLTKIFGGTLGGMTIAMTSSLIISLYLLIFPPKLWNKRK